MFLVIRNNYVKNTLGVNHANLNSKKVLGIQWGSTSDQLSFDVHHIYSRFYDPLGILSPCTVIFEILFQNLCIKKVGWDEPLKHELLLEWKRLLDNLKQLQWIIIPRFYSGMGEKIISCSLIEFCDASRQAYAAVV